MNENDSYIINSLTKSLSLKKGQLKRLIQYITAPLITLDYETNEQHGFYSIDDDDIPFVIMGHKNYKEQADKVKDYLDDLHQKQEQEQDNSFLMPSLGLKHLEQQQERNRLIKKKKNKDNKF